MHPSPEIGLIPNSTIHSYADVVGKALSPPSSSILLKLPSTYKGEPVVFFTKEEIVNLKSPFKFA